MDKKFFSKNRTALMNKLDNNSIVILFAGISLSLSSFIKAFNVPCFWEYYLISLRYGVDKSLHNEHSLLLPTQPSTSLYVIGIYIK